MDGLNNGDACSLQGHIYGGRKQGKHVMNMGDVWFLLSRDPAKPRVSPDGKNSSGEKADLFPSVVTFNFAIVFSVKNNLMTIFFKQTFQGQNRNVLASRLLIEIMAQ